MNVFDAPIECRFNRLTRVMRTLVDLLHTEHGYARIFYDQEGYSYELHSYRHEPMSDLFTRMLGYASVEDATEAARETLSAIHETSRARIYKGSRVRTRRSTQVLATQLILPVSA